MNKVVLSLALLAATACSSFNKNSLRADGAIGASPSAEIGWEPTTVAFEQKLSDEISPEVKKVFPPASDLVMQEFIAKVGNKLLSADVFSNPPPYRWNFTVVDSTQAKSFSLPAGEVFVTTALIAKTESEAELAGVIAIEISHVLLKHTTRRIQSIRQVNKNWNMVGGGFIGGSMGYGMGKVSEDPSNGAQKWSFLEPTAEQNNEADAPGLSIAIKAGYDSRHVGRYFQKTSLDKKGKVIAGLEQRAELMGKFCTESGEKGIKGLVSSDGFEKVRAKARVSKPKAKG